MRLENESRMIIYETKSELIARKILVHIAQYGISDLASFSKLSKSIEVGRSLLYFYFKSEVEIIDTLYQVFVKEVDYHFEYIKERQFNFDEYLNYLVDMKVPYFMVVECMKVYQQRDEFKAFVDYVAKGIDHYSQQMFIKKYQLEHMSQERLDYMYNSLRSYWFERSGHFKEWNYAKVSQLRDDLDEYILGLKDDFSSSSSS